jgi:hypothetical protein
MAAAVGETCHNSVTLAAQNARRRRAPSTFGLCQKLAFSITRRAWIVRLDADQVYASQAT